MYNRRSRHAPGGGLLDARARTEIVEIRDAPGPAAHPWNTPRDTTARSPDQERIACDTARSRRSARFHPRRRSKGRRARDNTVSTLRENADYASGDQNAPPPPRRRSDRKSTRLNSSHSSISYAVFCLKKKKKKIKMKNHEKRETINASHSTIRMREHR